MTVDFAVNQSTQCFHFSTYETHPSTLIWDRNTSQPLKLQLSNAELLCSKMPKRGHTSAKASPSKKRVKISEESTPAEEPKIETSAPTPETDVIEKDDSVATGDGSLATVEEVLQAVMPSTEDSPTIKQEEQEHSIDFDALEDDPSVNGAVPGQETLRDSTLLNSDKGVENSSLAGPDDSADENVNLAHTEDAQGADTTKEDSVKEQPEVKAAEDEAEKAKIAATAQMYARSAIAFTIHQQMQNVPQMSAAAGLNSVGDQIKARFDANGLTLELTLNVVRLADEQQESSNTEWGNYSDITDEAIPKAIEKRHSLSVDVEKAQNALQKSGPLSAVPSTPNASQTIPCRFGAACTKRDQCPFEHAAGQGALKKKMCSYLNTTVGCSKGDDCPFSHDHEDTKCARSKLRTKCANGYKCAFKHDDDYIDGGPKEYAVKKQTMLAEAAHKAALARASREVSVASQLSPAVRSPATRSPPSYAPTGPKLGKGAGQKRGAADQGHGHQAQRSWTQNHVPYDPTSQQHQYDNGESLQQRNGRGARARGSVRGRGRGGRGIVNRGRGAKQQVGDTVHVKGAATQHDA